MAAELPATVGQDRPFLADTQFDVRRYSAGAMRYCADDSCPNLMRLPSGSTT